MNDAAISQRDRTPKWVWLIMIALPAVMPITFAWIAFFPPDGAAPTGIHGVDGAVFINCMRMFESGFYTPFANCHALLGNHSSAYFAAPFFWMYGLLGALGRIIHANEFLLLGIANGVGGFLYLLAAYFLLRTAFPKQADLAFALFALAGGPGGVLYIATWVLGLHDAPQFEPYFYRYALYQLFEGARPSPILAMPRLYYTVSMACCLAAIACFLKSTRDPSRRLSTSIGKLDEVLPDSRPLNAPPYCPPLKGGRGDVGLLQQSDIAQEKTSPLPPFKGGLVRERQDAALPCGNTFPDSRTGGLRVAATVLLFLGTFVNLRYGPMAWGVIVIYLIVDANQTLRERVRLAGALLAPVALAWVIGWWMLRRSPAFIEGATEHIRTHMWLSPFVSAMLFHLLVVPRQTILGTRSLPRMARIAGSAALGYLAAYGILYVLYNAYYGNLWLCLDVTSAMRISDVSLFGAAAGALWGLTRHRTAQPYADVDTLRLGWVSLWLVCFLSIAISAFGQGWFLRLVPERAMIFLGLPFAVLAAKGLQEWQSVRPRLAAALLAVMLACGLCAIGVASACFQGPLGHRPGKGPYGYAHCELMNKADADLLARIEGGVVLTPITYGPSFGDVLAIRPGTSVVYGFGSVNLGDRDPAAAKEDIAGFFSEGCAESFRRQFAEQWCVKYVYCPDSHPASENVIEDLGNTPWLQEVATSGRAVLFKVVASS